MLCRDHKNKYSIKHYYSPISSFCSIAHFKTLAILQTLCCDYSFQSLCFKISKPVKNWCMLFGFSVTNQVILLTSTEMIYKCLCRAQGFIQTHCRVFSGINRTWAVLALLRLSSITDTDFSRGQDFTQRTCTLCCLRTTSR